MEKIYYKRLYLDFINDTALLSNTFKTILSDKIKNEPNESIPFRRLMLVNEMIKNHLSENKDIMEKRYQQLKAYDKEYIEYILYFQRQYNLTNTEISLKFRLSRNTIAKWKKQFKTPING